MPEQDAWKSRSEHKADQFIDSLDATSALHLAERAIAADAEKAAADQFQKDQKTFCVMYPSYKNNDHNAQLMKHHWTNALGVAIPTLEQLEESFFALRESGVLQLDAKQVAKEDQEATLRRAAEIREKREANAFDEDAAYSMPFLELEKRARGW